MLTPPLVLAQAAGPGCGDFAILMVGMLFILYFFVLRPQIKDEKKKLDFHASLKVDDAIVTQGGILGRIVELDGERVLIEVAPRMRFRVEKAAIRELQKDKESASARGKDASSDDAKSKASEETKSKPGTESEKDS